MLGSQAVSQSISQAVSQAVRHHDSSSMKSRIGNRGLRADDVWIWPTSSFYCHTHTHTKKKKVGRILKA